MLSWFRKTWDWIWDSATWVPREYCGPFEPWLKRMHIWSDKAISLEFQVIIPLALITLWFIFRKRARYSWFLLVFSAFIWTCGLGHRIDSWAFDAPTYRAWGIVKCSTAISGGIACISLICCFPKLRLLKTTEECEQAAQSKADRQSRDVEHALSLTNLVLDNAADAMYLLDMDNKVTYANPRAVELFGFSVEEMKYSGKTLHELIHHKRPDGTPFPIGECPLQSCYLEKRPLKEHKDVFWNKYGRPIDVLVNMIPVFKGDHMDGTVISVRNTTEDTKRARELAEANRMRQVVLDGSTSAMFLVGSDGLIHYVNRRAITMFGYSESEMIGQKIHQLIHNKKYDGTHYPESECPMYQAWERLEDKTDFEELFWSKDNLPVLCLCNMTLMLKDGGISSAVYSMTDITVQKESLRKVKEAEFRYRRLCDSNIVGIGISHSDGTWSYANEKLLDMVGYTHEEMLSGEMNWLEMTPPDQRHLDQHGIGASIRDGHTAPYEKEYIRRDGTRVPILIGYAKMNGDDAYLCMVLDLTEPKQYLAELEDANRRAEAANESKNQFLAVLSHELRTPLTPCLLLASTLSEHPDTPEVDRPHFQMFKRNLDLEARLIDDCLDIMMVLKGKMNFRWEVIDAHRKIDLAVDICRPDIESKGIHLDVRLNAGQHHLNADAARIQQVVWNLVKNSVKYTPSKGTITIRTYNTANGDLAIEVSDTGIGMSPEVMAHVFDAFSQAENNLGRQYGGLGLGLAISKAIIEGHRGRIQVSSPGLGEGSKFLVTLPATFVPPVVAKRIDRPVLDVNSNKKGAHIFLIEDDPSTQQTMVQILKVLGYTVEAAGSMREALTFDVGRFDLIVSDIGLGGGTGFDLMAHIRQTSGIPGIALTGYGQEKDILRSHEVGFSAHLTKPIDIHKLQEAIVRVLNRS